MGTWICSRWDLVWNLQWMVSITPLARCSKVDGGIGS